MLKQIVVIAVVLSLTGLSLTALIMSTGKYWRCPGEPLLFSWLLGFGIIGILFSWLVVVIMIHVHFKRYCDNNHPLLTLYMIVVIISYVFAFIWSVVGIQWTGSALIKPTDYYINGKNLYCDSVVFRYTQALSILTLTLATLILSLGAHALKSSQ